MTDAEGSAADRLERALRQHEEGNKREPLTPQQVQTRVLLAKVKKLPRAQRMEVLKSAGMELFAPLVGLPPKRPAPPLPETRVTGSAQVAAAYERMGLTKAIDWDYWSMIPELPLWVAVALSLGKNPGDMSGNHHAQYIQMPGYARRVFGEECAKRLDIGIANLSASGPLVPVRLYQGATRDPRVLVTMQGFCRFVQSMTRPWSLPDGFPLPNALQLANDAAEPGESREQRIARRLARFRALGADLRAAGDGWTLTGIRGALATLANEESAAGRQMSSRPDVRKDLNAAMEAEKKQMR